MNVRRTVTIGAAGGAIVVWIAAAATSNNRAVAPVVPFRPTAADKSGADLAIEVKRLHERLRPSDTPVQARDLFRFSSQAHAGPGRPLEPRSRDVVEPAPAVPPQPAPTLKLEGLAEDRGLNGPVRTAIISGSGDIYLVKEGDAVAERFRVTSISADAVELLDLSTNTPLRLNFR
jgi:hypothetical protein